MQGGVEPFWAGREFGGIARYWCDPLPRETGVDTTIDFPNRFDRRGDVAVGRAISSIRFFMSQDDGELKPHLILHARADAVGIGAIRVAILHDPVACQIVQRRGDGFAAGVR